MNILIDSYTDVGGRENNEDSYKVCKSDNGTLLIVADGLGGHSSGELASSIAITCLEKEFNSENFNIEQAIKNANADILQVQFDKGINTKTTVTAVWIKDEKTIAAHVGDSRIYFLKDNEIIFQSIDHSLSQIAVKAGDISLAEIRHHEDRNVLVRALGAKEDVKVDISEFNTDEIDSILLCSDGFWEYVLEEEMIAHRKTSKNPDVWIYKMREELTRRIPDNNDNNTAIAAIIKRK